MSLIMPDGSRTISYGPPGSGFPQYEDFMGQAANSGNKAAQKLASLPSQQQQAKPQQQQAQPQATQQPPSKGMDMSAYKPGQAQPVQTPSQGTPYGQPAQQPSNPYANMQPGVYQPSAPPVNTARPAPGNGGIPQDAVFQPAYLPTQGRGYAEPTAQNGWQGGQIIDDRGMVPQYPPQTQYSPSFLDGYQPPAAGRPMPGQNGIPQDAIFRQPANTQTYTTPGFTYSPGGTPQYGGQGNVANDPYGKPPPFVSTMTDMFGNPTTADQFYPQQDAFIAQLLERMGQIQGGTWLGQGPPPQDFGRRPDMNFGEMWNQGGQMVSDGWRNPFSAQPIQPSAPQTPQRDGLRYVPAEYRDGKLWSDAHYVNDNPPIPEYAPPGMYGARDPVLMAPESYYPGFDPRTQDPYGRPLPSGPFNIEPWLQTPGTAQPIQPPSQGTPYWMGERNAPQPPRKDPGQEFNEQMAMRDASLKRARREGKVLDVNGNLISPKNLPPELYADWLKTGRPQY